MSEFKREKRYIVLKTSKLNNDQLLLLGHALDALSLEQSATPECVVVEADWPNYEETWGSIMAVATGQYRSKAALALQCENYRQAIIQSLDEMKVTNFNSATERLTHALEMRPTHTQTGRKISDEFSDDMAHASYWFSGEGNKLIGERGLVEAQQISLLMQEAFLAGRNSKVSKSPGTALENEFYNWAKAHGLIVDGHPPHATVMQRYDELVFAEIPELKEQLHLAQDAQQVYWHSPDTAPAVAEGSLCLCWIAVRQHCEGTEPQVRVFAANYINKPLFLDENGEPTAEDYHVTADGEPVGAVGWHNEHHHPEFSAYFEEITFSDSYQLLGWAEYKPPMWGAV